MSLLYETLTGLSSLSDVDNITTNTLNVMDSATIANLKISGLTASRPVFTDIVSSLKTENMVNGSLIIGNAGGYSINTLQTGHNIDINNTAGNISVGVVDSPSFTDVTLNNLTAKTLIAADASKKLISAALTNGQIHVGDNTNGYQAATITQGSNIQVTNGYGSISIATTLTPTFSSLVDTALDTFKIVATDGSKALKSVPMTSGTVLIGNEGGYSVNTLTPSTNISISNSPGAISIATTSTPSFTSITDTGLTASRLLCSNASKVLESVSFSAGQLIGTTGGGYALASLTAGLNTDVVSLSGAISIGVTSTPSFTSITDTGLTASRLLCSNASKVLESISFSAGQIPIGVTGGGYSLASIASGLNTNVVSASGAITVNTIASPSFSSIVLTQSGSYTTTLAAQTTAANLTFSLPTAYASAGQYLTSDASGNLQWGVPSGSGGGGATIIIAGTNMSASFDGVDTYTLSTVGSPSFSGVNLTGLTASRLIASDSSKNLVSLAASADGAILLGSSSGSFVSGTLGAGSNVSITNGTNSVSIATSLTPGFTSVTSNSLILNQPSSGYTTTIAVPNGAGDLTFKMPAGYGSSGQLVTSDGAGNLSFVTPSADTGGTNISIDYGLSTISTIASPTFTGVTLSGLTASRLVATDSSKNLTNVVSTANGAILLGSSSGSFVSGTLTDGLNMNIINGTNSVTIATVATPSFSSVDCASLMYTVDLSTSSLVMRQPSSGYTTTLYARNAAGNLVFQLPDSLGASGQVLGTDGSGAISWTTPTVSGSIAAGTNMEINTVDAISTLSVVASPIFTAVTAPTFNVSNVGGHNTIIRSQSTSSDAYFNLPSTGGSSGQLLSTNGSGDLLWIPPVSYSAGLNVVILSNTISVSPSPVFTSMGLFQPSGSNKTYLSAATTSSDLTFTLPTTLGTADYLLKTDGSGNLSWTAPYSISSGNNIIITGGTGMVPSIATLDDVEFISVGLSQPSGSHKTYLRAATTSSNLTLTLPTTAGTADYLLKTDGSGNLSWATPSSVSITSGKNISISGSTIATLNDVDFDSIVSRVVNSEAYVNNTMTTAEIQAVFANGDYSVINFVPGNYTLTSFLHIDRRNVTVNGNGANLTLADNTNTPLLVIGGMGFTPLVQDVVKVHNLYLDGNNANQTSPTCDGYASFDTSVIIITSMSLVTLSDLIVEGGYVSCVHVYPNCDTINITDCSFFNAYNAGLYIDSSEYVNVSKCLTYGCYTGSDVTDSRRITLGGNIIAYSEYGMHLKNVTDITISDNIVTNSTYGVDFTTDAGYTEYKNNRCTFTGNIVDQSADSAMRFQSCAYFVLSSNTISNTGTYGMLFTGYGAINDGISSYCTVIGNTIAGSTAAFYNDDSNSFTYNATSNIFSNNVTLNNVSGDFTSWNIFSWSPNNSGGSNDLLTTDGNGNAGWVSRSDVLAAVPIPAFYQNLYTDTEDTTSAYWEDTTCYLEVTPQFSTSSFEITFTGMLNYTGGGIGRISIFRDVSGSGLDVNLDVTGAGLIVNNTGTTMPISMNIIDSPATTSLTTYRVKIRISTDGTVTLNPYSLCCPFVVKELFV